MDDRDSRQHESGMRSGPEKGSERAGSFSKTNYLAWIKKQLAVLEEAMDVVISETRKGMFARDLMDLPQERLAVAFCRARRELKFFPKIAELRELAGATDGRLGPEEAWALCPRSEDQTVVWTPEIARAFNGGARELLGVGDEIAARMAFKEVYEREVAEARAMGRPVEWEASLGWKRADRVAPVALAVANGRISREYAFNVIQHEQHDELRLMLPAGPEVPQLQGKSEVRLPGLYGVLQQMRMEGTVPEGCDPKKPVEGKALSEEQVARRKEMLKEQIERMRKRKEGA